MSDKPFLITPEIVRAFLSYDPVDGSFTWKKRDREHFKSLNSWSRWNNRYAGKKSGSVYRGATGYECIFLTLSSVKIKGHRAAWMYMTGEEPPATIDHIDRDGTNNAWANIRAGCGLNNYNMSKRRDNKSGVTGVSWSKVANSWHARAWGEKDGKRKYVHVGYFKDISDAEKAIKSFRAAQGYSPEHGREHAHYVDI